MRSVTTMAVAAAVALGTASTAPADRTVPPPWRIVDASGLASLSSQGACRSLVRDAALPPGATIVTRAHARVTLDRRGETIALSPQTDLTVAEPEGVDARIVQRRGWAWYKVGKLQSLHFRVETPELTATVRGTTFTVAVDPTGAAVHVREGAVEVATGWRDAVTLVRPGTMASVTRSAPDRIALINGGNVMRVVTGRDAPGPAGLRRGGGAVGTLFADGYGMRRTTEVRLAQEGETQAAGGGPTGQTASGLDGARGLVGGAPAARSPGSSREKALGLPVLETTLGALILLALIVVHTFWGSASRSRHAGAKSGPDPGALTSPAEMA